MSGGAARSLFCLTREWLKRGILVTTSNRYRVIIRCPACGEKYILRGKRNEEGEYETGFKQCICGNEEQLNIEVSPE